MTMSEFVLSYRAPRNYQGSPEAAATWERWFDSLGSSLVDRGNPVFVRSTHGVGDGDTVLGGYSLVAADSLAAAVSLARDCPMVASGGGVEVGELVPVPGRRHPARTY
jgi:hypothetical protein